MKNLFLPILLIHFIKAEAQTPTALIVSQKADSLFEIGEYSKAVPHYIEAKQFEKVAQSYEALGNTIEAQNYFEKALSAKKSNPKTEFKYAKLLVRLSNYKKADSVLQSLHNRFPDNPNFIYEEGLIKEAQNDSTAIQFFLQVHQMDKNNLNAIYKIARNYVENREFEKAATFIERGLDSDRNSSRFLTLRALKEFYTEEFHEAIETYNLLLLKGDRYLSLHENLAKAYAQTFQTEKALEQYNILFQTYDDKNPKWHHEIAVIYRTNREYEKAERHFNIAIALLEIPLSNEYYELSKLYRWNKDYKNEIDNLRKSLVNNPNNEMASYYLAVAADNYFKDKNSVLEYYENYIKKFGETGRMRNLAKQRVSDLKKELHFHTD